VEGVEEVVEEDMVRVVEEDITFATSLKIEWAVAEKPEGTNGVDPEVRRSSAATLTFVGTRLLG